MSITVQELAAGLIDTGQSLQWLGAGKDRERVPCTAGTLELEKIVKAVEAAMLKKSVRTDKELALIERARGKYAAPSSDDIAVYDDAKVSKAGDEGVWVEAYVFLRDGESNDA